MTQACELYYRENLNQQEITERLHVSRPSVSKLLTEARKLGIVKITIEDSFSEEKSLSELLCMAYDLKDSIIIDTKNSYDLTEQAQVGRAGAEYLEKIIHDGDTVTLGAGVSVSALSKQVRQQLLNNCMISPMTGGWGNSDFDWQANQSVIYLANKWRAHYKILNAPAFILNEELCRYLMQEPAINEVLECSSHADIAIIGIGTIDSDSTVIKKGNPDGKILQYLNEKKACASFGNWFVDEKGELIDLHNRILGIGMQDYDAIPVKIAMAFGTSKIKAIKAVLSGKRVNVLITDLETARELV